MRLLVSDDIGLVKEVNLSTKSIKYVSNASGADLAVENMCWLDTNCSKVAVSRASGAIDIFELSGASFDWIQLATYDFDEPAMRMIVSGNTLLVVGESTVSTLQFNKITAKPKIRSLPGGPYTAVDFVRSGPVSESNPVSFRPVSELPTRIIAAAGEACPVVIDIEKLEVVWSGKNASDTPIGLSSKFSTTCIQSLSERIFTAGDLSGKLRFYDIVTQRKPVLELPVFEVFTVTNNYTGTSGMGQTRPIKELALSPDGTVLYMGDTYGSVLGLELKKAMATNAIPVSEAKIATARHTDFCRKLMPMSCGFKGVMGSVRAIAVTASTVYVVSAGRFAYSFDIKTRGKKMEKVFLKQKLTACLAIESELEVPADKRTNTVNTESDELVDDEEIEAGAEEVLEMLGDKISSNDGMMTKSKRRRLRKGTAKD